MALNSDLINQPCTIVRRTTSDEPDELGNDQDSEELVETACYLEQKQRDEDDTSEVSATGYLAVFGPDEVLRSGDALILDGQTYEVSGKPARVWDPFVQAYDHIEADVELTAGADDEVGS